MTTDPSSSEALQPADCKKSVEAALAVMQTHIDALNRRDEKAIAATLHFPHYRLANEKLMTWETGEGYLADFRKRAGRDWGYSSWGRLDVIHASVDKVHLDVQVDRYRQDGHLLASFSSIWVIARMGGRWAALLRSTFAPDTTSHSGQG